MTLPTKAVLMKLCTKCGVKKPKAEFNKNNYNKSGLTSWCKTCNNIAVKKYKTTPKGKETNRKSNKKYRDTPEGKEIKRKGKRKYNITPKGKLSARKAHLKRTYGITLEEYDTMLKDQEYVCAICGTDKLGGIGRFHVDHNHITGKIRGLLCTRCNTKLGIIEDEKFNKLAIIYLSGDL